MSPILITISYTLGPRAQARPCCLSFSDWAWASQRIAYTLNGHRQKIYYKVSVGCITLYSVFLMHSPSAVVTSFVIMFSFRHISVVNPGRSVASGTLGWSSACTLSLYCLLVFFVGHFVCFSKWSAVFPDLQYNRMVLRESGKFILRTSSFYLFKKDKASEIPGRYYNSNFDVLVVFSLPKIFFLP